MEKSDKTEIKQILAFCPENIVYYIVLSFSSIIDESMDKIKYPRRLFILSEYFSIL